MGSRERREAMAARMGRLLGGLVLGTDQALAADVVRVELADVPDCDDVSDSILWCLGLVFAILASCADVEPMPYGEG